MHQLKQKMRGLTISVMRSVIKQPQIKAVALFTLSKIPKTKAYLNNIALSGGLSTSPQREIKLSELNSELGSVSIANSFASKVTDIDYFESKIAQKLCQTYTLNFDFDLIEKIRQGQKISYSSYSGEQLKLTIVHFYLALLYRFPSNNEIKQCSTKVIKKSSFESLMPILLNSPDYEIRGRKEVLS